MKISVITPSYNQGEFLKRTMQSVVDQGYPDLEFLVFDGGSTDDSVQIIESFESHLSHWESKPDRGQSHAINKGFERATGDVVTWLNSDDTLLPGALTAVNRVFEADEEIDAVYGDFVYMDANDNMLRRRHLFRKFRYETLLFHDYLGQPAVFYRRRVLEKIGLLDEALKYSMDWDFFLRMKRQCNMVHLAQPLAGYRLHPEAKSSQEGDAEYDECLKTIYERNKPVRFEAPWLNRMYLGAYRWYSRFQRLLAVIRDNPIAYWRMYKVVTGGRLVRGLIWRWKY